MSSLRDVTIIVSNQTTTDVYYARSYPDDDHDDDGKIERYKTPVYKVFIDGTDASGKSARKEWKGLRFMPFWNDPRRPSPHYKARGWINSGKHQVKRKPVPAYIQDYETHNRYSRYGGAVQIEGNFLVHAGPETTSDHGWGAAGCVEIIGSFDDFRRDILDMAGSAELDIHRGMQELVRGKKLYIQVDLARPPDLKSARDGDF